MRTSTRRTGHGLLGRPARAGLAALLVLSGMASNALMASPAAADPGKVETKVTRTDRQQR